MKISYLLMLFFAAGIIFSGCDKNENGDGNGDEETPVNALTVNVSNIEGLPLSVTKVKLQVDISGEDDYAMIDCLGDVIATVLVDKGGFTMNLDMEVPDDKLVEYSDCYPIEPVLSPGATDPRTNIFLFACYEGEEFVGIASPSTGDWNYVESSGQAIIYYVYSDTDLSCKGNYHPYYFDLTFKRGWNIQSVVVAFDSDSDSMIGYYTNTPPEDLDWRFFSK